MLNRSKKAPRKDKKERGKMLSDQRLLGRCLHSVMVPEMTRMVSLYFDKGYLVL